MNIAVRPELLRWARTRASLTVDELASKVGTKKSPAPIEAWESAQTSIEVPVTQLEKLARVTRAPFGMLFLSEPPSDELPLRDFRRLVAGERRKPSLELIETIAETQVRQSWLSERFEEDGEEALNFIGSATLSSDPYDLARTIRDDLGIGPSERRQVRHMAESPLWMIERLDESRITVVRKGYARSATKRTLYREEFKGFALADRFAPFIFVNGKDWPASQVFTIAHECVHLWLGASAIPDGDWFGEPADPTERFCNRVAAEILMPEEEMRRAWRSPESAENNVRRIAEELRVSSLAALFRARSLELISEEELERARARFQAEFDARKETAGGGGGNWYNAAGISLGKRFVREVLLSTLSGRTLYSEAFDLLGTRKTSVVQKMATVVLGA